MKATHLLKGVSIILLSALSSCMDNDVYDSNSKKDNGNVTDLIVPSNYTWSTTNKVAVNVSIGNQANHTYTLQILPQGAGEKTLPIAAGVVSKNEPFREEIIVPASDTIVTIVQKLKYSDGSHMMLQSNAPIANGQVQFVLGGSNKAATRSLAANTRSAKIEGWEDMTELTEDIKKIDNDVQYKISAGKEVSLNKQASIAAGAEIYIAGQLIIPAENNPFENKPSKLIVLSAEQSSANESSANESGSILCKGDFTIKNGFEIDNYGTINVAGTFAIHNGAEVDNYACIYANKVEIDGNGEGGNGKDDSEEDDSGLEMEEGSYLEAQTMWMQKATIEMEANSFINIAGTLEFKNDCKIEGDDKWAVVKIGEAVVKNENNGKYPTIKDGVFVVCENNNGARPEKIIVEDDAYWGNEAAALETNVEITAGSCAPGYTPEGGGTPEEPDTEHTISLNTYSYAFEDLWPSFGDYDMNDLILKTDVTLNIKNGYVSQAILDCEISAIGSTRKLAAAVQLDEVTPDNISSIEYNVTNNFTEGLFKTASNGTEQEQSLAVVPLFDNAHAFSGVDGTYITGTHKNAKFDATKFTVTINLKENSIEKGKLSLDKWNFFITANSEQGPRGEIHLIDKKATDLFDKSFIRGEVASINTPFRSKGNFCWAMQIPNDFRFPLENNNIRESFENFDSWISNPEYDWYNHPIEGKVK